MPIARPSEAYPNLSWSGWGDPDEAVTLPDALLRLLADGLGVSGSGRAAGALSEIMLAPSRLPERVLDRLSAIIGAEHADAGHEARVRHMRGKSTPDLLRLRRGDARGAPDVVLRPATHDEVLRLLSICSEQRIAVVPFGGGTSVVGGLDPDRGAFAGVAALDLRRMDALLELDEVSRLAVLQPGLRGPQVEALLAQHGYTIGHYPQSFEYATVGGAAAARSSGQSSAGYGRFDELVMALKLATPAGSLSLGRAPRSAGRTCAS
jgi:alkyldihydroxyacetonephosphate synthase